MKGRKWSWPVTAIPTGRARLLEDTPHVRSRAGLCSVPRVLLLTHPHGTLWILSCNTAQRGLESWSSDNWVAYYKTKYWLYYHLWKKILSMESQKWAVNLLRRTWNIAVRRELAVFQMKAAGWDVFAGAKLQAEQTLSTSPSWGICTVPNISFPVPSTSVPKHSASSCSLCKPC